MVHCNKDLAKGNDCSSYYIYKALKDKLEKFIADINKMKKIERTIELGEVNFHNSTFDHINFILGKAKLNLDTGEISTVLNPHNPQNIRLDFIKKTNEKIDTISVICYKSEGRSLGSYEYDINDNKTLFKQDFLYKFNAFTSISEEDMSNFQNSANNILNKTDSTIGDLITEYNNTSSFFNSTKKTALNALILEHYKNVLKEIEIKIQQIDTNEKARIEEKNHNDEEFKKFYVPRLKERRDEYNSKFETSDIYIKGIKELQKKYEENFPERTTKDELKKEYELQKKPVNQHQVGGKKTRRSRKTIHAKKYKTIRKKSIFTPFLI
jgi:hypothetical protein